MRCPVCQADLPANSERCPTCPPGQAPRRKSGRKRNGADDGDSPFRPCTNPSNRPALRAYHLSLFAMIPVLGAVLGPLAIFLALRALSQQGRHPAFTALGPARAAIVLGVLVTLTNWAGLTLIALGLQ